MGLAAVVGVVIARKFGRSAETELALARSKARQVPLGGVDDDELPEEVRELADTYGTPLFVVDEADRVHARRWTNRQGAHSAVSDSTTSVLIVAEALHDSARSDAGRLAAALVVDLRDVWSLAPSASLLAAESPRSDL
jgi:DNA/RNA-binding domain of Phe-tRNA-synthetase-like protein